MIMMMMMTKKRKQLYCASIYIEKAIKATTTATAILFTFATQHNKNNTNACKICFLLLNSSRVEPDWHRRRRIVIVLCWCYCCSSFCCCCCYFCLSPLFRFLSWFVCMYVCMFTQNSFFFTTVQFNLPKFSKHKVCTHSYIACAHTFFSSDYSVPVLPSTTKKIDRTLNTERCSPFFNSLSLSLLPSLKYEQK